MFRFCARVGKDYVIDSLGGVYTPRWGILDMKMSLESVTAQRRDLLFLGGWPSLCF
jgi:hypothetical protein